MIRAFALGILMVELSGCLGRGESIPLRRLDNFSPYYSGFVQPERRVITDLASWRSIWEQIVGFQVPPPELPAIDFTREMVIVVSMGRRNTGGYAIKINHVSRDMETGLSVFVTETSPGQACVVTLALTSPVDLVIIPRSGVQATFVEQQETLECK